jgi:TfoX/Sxy family transcriptional regulator of competence genes
MPYNETLANRVRETIYLTHKNVEEKKIFGGLAFMVNGKMCVSVKFDRIMIRHDPALFDELMEKPGCRPMQFSNRIMKGYTFVEMEELNTQKKLGYWVGLALAYNAKAPSSKKKKKK